MKNETRPKLFLKLNKHTLRPLSPFDLKAVAGGGPPISAKVAGCDIGSRVLEGCL